MFFPLSLFFGLQRTARSVNGYRKNAPVTKMSVKKKTGIISVETLITRRIIPMQSRAVTSQRIRLASPGRQRNLCPHRQCCANSIGFAASRR